MNTQTFPFHFGTVVSGDFFYDRAAESRALHDEIVGGQNVVLYAPRRYGKTSLIHNAFCVLEKDHAAV